MNDWIVFLKLNFALAIIFAALVIVSISIVIVLKKYPEKIGLKNPINKNLYWFSLVPIAMFIAILIRDRTEGLTSPTHIDQHGNIIFVKGYIETIRERLEDEVSYSQFENKFFMYDKATGKQINIPSSLEALYLSDGKLLCSGPFGYPIIDLNDGRVQEIKSKEQITESIAKYSPDKIYSIEPDASGAYFSIRTVLDKVFLYDPIKDMINPEGGKRLFIMESTRIPIASESLFHAEAIGITPDGLTIVHSFDNLEMKTFFLSALNASGKILWSKRDEEISPKLQDEIFTDSEIKNNIVIDEKNLYFITKRFLVCLSSSTGNLEWITPI